jgi:hypothetical protein
MPRENTAAKQIKSSGNSVCNYRWAESTEMARIVSGAAATTESTRLVDGAAGSALFVHAASPMNPSPTKRILIINSISS